MSTEKSILEIIHDVIKTNSPESIVLSNNLEVTVNRTANSNVRITTKINIAIETFNNDDKTLSALAKALASTEEQMRKHLRETTETWRLVWETKPPISSRTAAFLIDSFVQGLPPAVMALTNAAQEEPLKRCLGCEQRYSPVCKYCPHDGTCSRCGTPMKYNKEKRDWICQACGRTSTQDFYYCPSCNVEMEWSDKKGDYECPKCKRTMAELR